MLLVVLKCLKDRAFHIWTVYVNSLHGSRQDSVAAGESPVSQCLSGGELVCFERFVQPA